MDTPLDSVQRFVFDQLDARGAVVRLTESCEAIQSTHHYPSALARVLNEFAAAVCLLRDSIKIEASITLQLRSPAAVSLIMADCMADRKVRAIAEYNSETLQASEQFEFDQLGAGSVLAITISPEEGERYQGIVPIEHSSLSQCLEDYFTRSEQLPTRFQILANETQVVAMALHALPKDKISDAQESSESFERIDTLMKTMQFDEAVSLDNEQMLTRLFHQESCRLFTSQPLEFGCQCSAQRSLSAIISLGQEEVSTMIGEQQESGADALVVDCHFCFQRYEIPIKEVLNAMGAPN